MSISSARLLAHRCCIYMLLLSVASIASANPTRITPTVAGSTVDLEDKGSDFVASLTKGKICQYNLTNSSHTLEAKSSFYQHQGYTHCEYIIQAPSSHVILLNFTDIHSKSDMPEEIGVRRQHPQQAASQTTTESTESVPGTPSPPAPPELQFDRIPEEKFPHAEKGKVKSADPDPDLQEKGTGNSVTSLAHQIDFVDSHASQRSSFKVTSTPFSASIHNSSVIQGGASTDSGDKGTSLNDTLSLAGIQERPANSAETVENSESYIYNELEYSQETAESSDSELRASPGFSKPKHVDSGAKPRIPAHPCSLKLTIEEVNRSAKTAPQVICWHKSWQRRIPLVYQYSVPVKITYKWDAVSQSGFSLDFSFLKPEAEADCLFRCNSHLCLPASQLCDGYDDCPDRSDEQRSACSLAQQQQKDADEPHMTVVIIIISVILAVIFVIGGVLMISRIRCRNGAGRGRDSLLQPPHSQSSEVCRSTSGSMQDSGQYEALLHERQHHHQHHQQQHLQRPATTSSGMVASSHSMEHHHLLHNNPHHQQMDQQGNPSNQLPHIEWDHQLHPTSTLAEVTATLPDDRHSDRSWQAQQQHKQPRHHKQARKQMGLDEHYPPHIPLSADGEEGYATAQKALHSKQQLDRNWQAENEVFRPPPNKTVYDRDSPPPPYSLNPPGAKSMDSLVPSVTLRPDRSSLTPQGSPPGVPRSHSLSCHH